MTQFERNKISIIGTADIKDFNSLKAWADGEGRHWEKKNWPLESPIGFYGLQSIVPQYHNTERFSNSYDIDYIENSYAYMHKFGQHYGLVYVDPQNRFVEICDATYGYIMPREFVVIHPYKDYDALTSAELKGLAGDSVPGLIPEYTVSAKQVKSQVSSKEDDIKQAENRIRQLEDEKKAELERLRQELDEKYRSTFEVLEKKKVELEEMKKKLMTELFLLESQIYAVRCYMGETIDFIQLRSGKHADPETPAVIYQKIRFLDEELGKYIALYDFDGEEENLKYFEKLIMAREDMQQLFAPGEKSVCIVKVSRSGLDYRRSDRFANILDEYSKNHGHMLGIIVRDGENIWIGYTDEEKINLHTDNAFLQPKSGESNDEMVSSTSKEEIASRYFLYATLQGIVDHGHMIQIPEKVSVYAGSRYVVLSMADGWIEDDRFGLFQDIIDQTDLPLKVSDTVLTVQHVERDDVYERSYDGMSRRHERYNNDRGRGEKNRTHDVSLSDCTLYPITCIDKKDTYTIFYRRHHFNVKKIVGMEDKSYSWKFLDEKFTSDDTDVFRVENDRYYGINTKKMTPLEIFNLGEHIGRGGYGENHKRVNDNFFDESKEAEGYWDEVLEVKLTETSYNYFISEEKTDGRHSWDYSVKAARANLQIYSSERLNLTYMNSVWIQYAIVNRKVGSWRIGGRTVDFAHSIRYLNKALEFCKIREEKEVEMLSKYMDLYPDWQIDVCKWRMEHGYHSLTETRAKAFTKDVGRGADK